MNAAHFHLVVNHFPIILTFAGSLVLLMGFIFKSEDVKRVSYILFIIASLTTFLSFISGEGAEKVLEHVAGIEEHYIETHEQMAKIFSPFMYLLGLVSIASLYFSFKGKGKVPTILGIITLILSLVVLPIGGLVANTGGQIRHTEIRKSTTQEFQKFKETENKNEEDESEGH